jgi:hypothetical protein
LDAVDLTVHARDRYVPAVAFALADAGLNDHERVFEWLEKARVVRDVHLIYVPMDPKWDPFRMKEPFQEMLRRAGLTR